MVKDWVFKEGPGPLPTKECEMKNKVRKLLALAMDPNAAPNEAETASRHAAALMARHNIDLAEEKLRAQSGAGYTAGLTAHIPTARPIGGKLRVGQ